MNAPNAPVAPVVTPMQVEALISRLFAPDAYGSLGASPRPADGDRILVGIRWEGLTHTLRVSDLRVPGGISLLRLGAVALPPGAGWLTLSAQLRPTLGRGPGAVGVDQVFINVPSGATSGKLYALFAEIGTELDPAAAWGVHDLRGASAYGSGTPMAIQPDQMPNSVPWGTYRVVGVGWSLNAPRRLHLKIPGLKASDGTEEPREHRFEAADCGWSEIPPATVQVHPFVETRPTLTPVLFTREVVWLVAEMIHDAVFGHG